MEKTEAGRLVTCFECEAEKPIEEMYEVALYDSPFGDEPHIEYLCKAKPDYYEYAENCLEVLYDTSWADFRYFTCVGCGREVCRQSPGNGWMGQVRVVDDEEICLRCYEEHILEHGIDREAFEAGRLEGMFFSGDNHEPLDAGYTEILHNIFINSTESARRVCQAAIEFIDSGDKVVVGYESLAIGGSEGYISLFVKEV